MTHPRCTSPAISVPHDASDPPIVRGMTRTKGAKWVTVRRLTRFGTDQKDAQGKLAMAARTSSTCTPGSTLGQS